MTDNDIIKALKCCVDNGKCKECPINPHYGNYGYCTNLALTYALDLINRQKAEIERLCNSLHVSSQNVENMARAMPNIAKATRIEAIKGFAEKTDKIITEIYNKFIFGDYDLGDEAREAIMDFCVDISHAINNLV